MQTLNIDRADQAEHAATTVRHKTIPREVGGGTGAVAAQALLGERAARVKNNKSALGDTLCKRRTLMPAPDHQMAVQALLGERCAELQELERQQIESPSQWVVRALPVKSERKAHWYFRWQREMQTGSTTVKPGEFHAEGKTVDKALDKALDKAEHNALDKAEYAMAGKVVDKTSNVATDVDSGENDTKNAIGANATNTDASSFGHEKKQHQIVQPSKMTNTIDLAPAARELRLTYDQAAQEWAAICVSKAKLDAITLAAAQYTLQRFTVSGKSKGGASKR
jgi:hypothetical protein